MQSPPKHQLSAYLEVAQQAASLAGDVLNKYWGKLTDIKEKTYPWDLVTEADKESERVVLECIKTHFPAHQILSEEAGLNSQHNHDYLWVVDPLDGTTNYTHQYPMVCVSIGLLYKGIPILGVIYNPIHQENFQAVRGLGATLNGQPIHVSKAATISHSLLCTGFAYNRQESDDNNYAEFCHITHISQGVRRGGSAALDLAYVAAGRLDGFWELGLKPWDIAAGIILIEEAGGLVSAYDGSPVVIESGRLIATNGVIHQELAREILSVRSKRGTL